LKQGKTMAKMNYNSNHSRYLGSYNPLSNSSYYVPKRPKKKTNEWSPEKKTKHFLAKISNNKHAQHDLDVVLTQTGPHAGKVICKTCNKHVSCITKAVAQSLEATQ
jgi:hypothetical protein